MHQPQPALLVKGLKTQFRSYDAVAKAVDDVSLDLYQGETLGLVGESGCGKSVTALSIMRLIKDPPGRISAEEIRLGELDLLKLSPKQMRKVRGGRISMIFQEPMTSLNPVFTVGSQIAEMFQTHRGASGSESWVRAVEMLKRVGIPAPERRAREYPHQLSGGMRQRAMIAMALACNPEAADRRRADHRARRDHPGPDPGPDQRVSSRSSGHAVMMITHDLGVIAGSAQRMIVMYAGRVVEYTDVAPLSSSSLRRTRTLAGC